MQKIIFLEHGRFYNFTIRNVFNTCTLILSKDYFQEIDSIFFSVQTNTFEPLCGDTKMAKRAVRIMDYETTKFRKRVAEYLSFYSWP